MWQRISTLMYYYHNVEYDKTRPTTRRSLHMQGARYCEEKKHNRLLFWNKRLCNCWSCWSCVHRPRLLFTYNYAEWVAHHAVFSFTVWHSWADGELVHHSRYDYSDWVLVRLVLPILHTHSVWLTLGLLEEWNGTLTGFTFKMSASKMVKMSFYIKL